MYVARRTQNFATNGYVIMLTGGEMQVRKEICKVRTSIGAFSSINLIFQEQYSTASSDGIVHAGKLTSYVTSKKKVCLHQNLW